jgi:hypothetical protein
MQEALIVAKLDAAKKDILQAEADLEKAMKDIQVAPRAEKLGISKVLEDAFVKLKAAKTLLTDIEALVVGKGV